MKGSKAKQILLDSKLEEGISAKTLKYGLLSNKERQVLLHQLNEPEELRLIAAIEIQRAFRGYCARCRLLHVVNPTASKMAVYSDSKHYLSRLDDVRTPSPIKNAAGRKPVKRLTARERLEYRYDCYRQQRLDTGYTEEDIFSFEEFCAYFIQQWWGSKAQNKTSANKQPKNKKQLLQRKKHELVKSKKKVREGPLEPMEATIMIQRAWRRHIDIQVYRYYRDLINFRQRGDPAMMLRCINPTEAKMLDSAAGIHIKFRLAGDKFPPNIYYKIYTHRPVQDLCANSPKDYTHPEAKRKMARDVHNHGNRVPSTVQVGWYQRMENNGWRLVSDRLINHAMSDPITWETSRKKVNFPHSKLKRRQDIQKQKKMRKIDWMKKMYQEGMLKARADDDETIQLIEGAAAGMVATVDAEGPAAVQDWEVDELLDWTTSLNFDDYVGGWKEIATSAVSEKQVDEKLKTGTPSWYDAYEIRLKNPYRENSTRPSFNTPQSALSRASAQ